MSRRTGQSTDISMNVLFVYIDVMENVALSLRDLKCSSKF